VDTVEKKLNYWEYWECGRETNGKNASNFGVCPSVVEDNWHDTNNGKNDGRYCWKIAGTMCVGTVKGLIARQINSCSQCPIFKTVLKEEGKSFK
jgi:hypothetical protein